MVNQALKMKIAHWSVKKEKEKENSRDRWVTDGSDKDIKLPIGPNYGGYI